MLQTLYLLLLSASMLLNQVQTSPNVNEDFRIKAIDTANFAIGYANGEIAKLATTTDNSIVTTGSTTPPEIITATAQATITVQNPQKSQPIQVTTPTPCVSSFITSCMGINP